MHLGNISKYMWIFTNLYWFKFEPAEYQDLQHSLQIPFKLPTLCKRSKQQKCFYKSQTLYNWTSDMSLYYYIIIYNIL